jgi:hypothetical protein
MLSVRPLSRKPFQDLARHAGFKSAGHFIKVIQEKADISITLALRFAEFCKFDKKQTRYFLSLVLYNQAKNQRSTVRPGRHWAESAPEPYGSADTRGLFTLTKRLRWR